MSFSLQYGGKGIWYGSFSSFQSIGGIRHGISTRFAGTSRAPFSTMNLALHNGDCADDVIENRRRFCGALQVDPGRLCTCEQVHGTQVLQVGEEQAGRGSLHYADAVAATDALITNVKDLPLLLFFADCTPILFFDPVHRAIGLAHAGWKGTAGKIAQQTVLAMQTAFGTNPAECLVAIGPSIGPCCYEVDARVAEQFAAAFANEQARILQPAAQGKWMLDLWAANAIQLEAVGVLSANIDQADVCTRCNSETFFSYRADHGQTGRIGALLCLK